MSDLAPEPYDPTEYHRIEITAKVEAKVRGTLYASSAQIREALGLPAGAPLTDEDLTEFAMEDSLDGVDLEVLDVTYWHSTDAAVKQRATTDPGN